MQKTLQRYHLYFTQKQTFLKKTLQNVKNGTMMHKSYLFHGVNIV